MFLSILGTGAVLAAAEGEQLKQVEAKYICFINKRAFKSPQTPVTIEGKTYYYCCDDCKETLVKDPKSRMDTDPVSHKEVAKISAVIGADSKGKVYFFESV